MNNLFKKFAGLRWWPDAAEENAPEGALLRADNTVPDRDGGRSLRQGSSALYSGLQEQRVQSLWSFTWDGTLYRLAGIDDRVYRNGVDFGQTFGGSGDIQFGDDAYQVFMARGDTKKKFDGTNFHNWSIPAPEFPATLAASSALTTEIASFDTAESPAFDINEGTAEFINNYAGDSGEAMQLTPDPGTGRASCSKTYAADTDMFAILGAEGGGTDLFDIRVWMEEPRKVDKITIMFGVTDDDDPFLDDYYYFDFNIRNASTVDIKDPASNVASVYGLRTQSLITALTPEEVTDVSTPDEVLRVLERLGRFGGPRSRERQDPQQNSPAWGHLSVTRGQFNRVGGTAGRDWTTVTGFKIVVTMVPGSTEVVGLDNATWTGGGSRALTGTFRVAYRFAREFQVDGATVYTELSPLSPVSDDVVLSQQALQVTIPAAALAAKDPQVDSCWVYLYGGFALETYFRCAITGVTPTTGMTIDELSSTPAGTNLDTPEERTRATTHGFSIAQGSGSASADLVFTVSKSEVEIRNDNEYIEPGAVPIPDDIVAVAGPWHGRMFMLTSEGWLYVTSQKRPSSTSVYHAVDLRKYGTPYWLAGTSSGIVAGFSDDIVRIAGTGDVDPFSGGVTVDLYGDPLNVGNPPVDAAFATDGNAIIYRSADGPMLLSGSSLTPIPFQGTSLLWRGVSRHGLAALETSTGRFRFEVDNHNIYMLAPEGDDDPVSIWRFDPQASPAQWSRLAYPFVPLSIFRENAGPLLVGSDEGSIHEIETGTQDAGVNIDVNIRTPWESGGNPLARKVAADFQMNVDTGGGTGTASFYKDGDASTAVTSVSPQTTGFQSFRAALTDFGTFRTARMVLTGAFNRLVLGFINITYRPLPQMVMVLDTGYVVPPNGADMAWVTELLLDCQSPSDLQIEVYKDDTLFDTIDVAVTPNKRTTYRKSTARGTKARRLRFVVKTTASAAAGSVGFEAYSLKARFRGTGNLTELLSGPVGGEVQ